jgi:hypothetical protein
MGRSGFYPGQGVFNDARCLLANSGSFWAKGLLYAAT